MTRLADISVAIQEGVVTLLQTQEMADALGLDNVADIGARLWDSPPDTSATLPYVSIFITEPRDVGGVGNAEVMASALVTVKVVGQEESYEPLGPAATAIHHALQGAGNIPLNGGGWWLNSRRRLVVSYPEVSDGVEYRHLGGTYEVNAQ